MTWRDLWQAEYGWRQDDKPDVWETALRRSMPDITDKEIQGGIGWLAKNSPSDYPRMHDLRAALQRLRREKVTQRDVHRRDGCPWCRTGWLDYDDGVNHLLQVPCVCAEPNNAASQKALEQLREHDRIATEWGEKWIAAGRPSLAEIVKDVDFGQTSIRNMTQEMRDEVMAKLRDQNKQAEARRLRGAAATQDLHERGVLT